MLTVLSRSSPLAIEQVQEIFRSLPEVSYNLKLFNTYGDAHKELSLLDRQKPDFFTDAIDFAILSGEGDIAIHSAKDLPWPLTSGLRVIALTRCTDNTDSLVSRNNLRLEELPCGSRVGTSSALRRKSLLAMRPDLNIVSIRGNIEERIEQVDNGHVDALIVATCALKRLHLDSRIAQVLQFETHPLQGMLAVVSRDRRPDLVKTFSPVDNRYNYGKVWIVGSGPGDPDLITKKGEKLLFNADVVVYDDLVNTEIIDSCSAEKVYVGKRKNAHSHSQDAINDLLYRKALAGLRTVRLKGGDSLVFARLGEEIDYLRQRHVPVEIVPGISSFQAAAADMMMPLTQRGLSNSITVLSGHNACPSDGKPAFAVFMGASQKEHVSSLLRKKGVDLSAKIALVNNASRPEGVRKITSLDSLNKSQLSSPLMIIAGATVPSDDLPRRILYTGLDSTECMLDGIIVHFPLIKTEPSYATDFDLSKFNGLVFTSRTAVQYFFERYGETDLPVYSIGPRTTHMIRRYGGKVAAQPEIADSDSLNRMLVEKAGDSRLIYSCSSLSQNPLHENRNIMPLVIYKTKTVRRRPVSLHDYSGVVFSSPSTCSAFFEIYDHFPRHLVAYVFGRPSFEKLKSKGIPEEQIIPIRIG